jgi:cytochrome c oxidase subunit 2
MDRFEKGVLIAQMTVTMVFLLALLVARQNYKVDIPECIPPDKLYTQGRAEMLDKHTWQLFYVARMWNFDPLTVEIPVGSEVDVYLTSADVVHGFNIAQKNVNMMAVPGTINKTTVFFDQPGEYSILCHEYCGTGHQFMEGKITVR